MIEVDLVSRESNGVCAIIAARNAAQTIGRAVASALVQPEVVEVVVVDDGSDDDTGSAALGADDGTGRLNVLRLDTNRGPAFARNHAIANSAAPLIAILDADDFFLRGRFAPLLATDDWDLVADNIVFIDAAIATDGREFQVRPFEPNPRYLDFAAFIEGNISRRGHQRGEIGFLKPVMRRAFLQRHGIRYREELRLGEDYELYARALANGARYRVIQDCGYAAVVRPDSLSGQHRTIDLKRLYEADRLILKMPGLSAEAIAALRRHERQTRDRFELRDFLDAKARAGLGGAALHALLRPAAWPAIIGGVAGDKVEALRRRGPGVANSGPQGLRYLMADDGAQK
ncbi:glycosyltransferase [Mesorhizobium xinjiangense]|uniref:glycosyltransferase n=1 Tax=Mesorhizobium xinjiangense TaxID=2678685 RepID=UPI0012ECD407|nr:glycosyltransferase [Mesorhizobium xinjiangense]